MSRQEKVSIDKIKKLIPINGNITNFTANVTLTAAVQNTPFLVAVDSQSNLDSNSDIPYKNVTDQVSFTIKNDNNVYQPYLLILKSDTPQEILISIDITEITGVDNTTPISTLPMATNNGLVTVPAIKPVWYKDWRIWAGIFVLLAIIVGFYIFSRKNNNKQQQPTVLEMSSLSV
ncbi:hypothetical protein AGMMS49579_01400 [Spirochaetia bacterium]|nr:hypothetical protein AGMMS49579_01400 [Spirochaetia bacterium]